MKTKRGWVGVVAVAIILAACIIGGCSLYGQYLEETEVTLTVKDKERIVDRDGSGSRYLIWTDDETFENIDVMMKGKFNSSDLYGQLERGKTYTCRVHGWRNGFFSMYRNLISCKEVEDGTTL